MKRLYIFLAMLGASASMAQNTMTISSASVGASQTFTLRVSIANSSLFTAFQFAFPVPDGFSYVGNSAALNSARVGNHQLTAIMNGTLFNVFAWSPNNAIFSGDTGTVVSFQFTSGKVPGTYPLILQSAFISDTNSVNVLTSIVNGQVTLLAPDIYCNESLVDFDRTPLGQTTDRSITIYNNGNQTLNVQSITFNSTYFSVTGSTSFSIAAYSNSTIQLRFSSVVKEIYNKTMTITSNDPDEPSVAINLRSRSFAVNELHTGNIYACSGLTGTLSFAVNNMEPFAGLQFDLHLPSPLTYIHGSASLSYRKTNHIVSAEMVAGNKLRVVVHSPDLQIFAGNSGPVLNLSFNVSGTGGYYPLTLSDVVIGDTSSANSISDYYDGTLQVASPDISSSATVNFGNIAVPENPQQMLRIYNYGSDTLKIQQITFSNPSYSLGITLPQNVLVFGYVDLPVNYHQNSDGQSNGVMRIFSNDPDEYPYLVNLEAFSYFPNYMILPDLEAFLSDTVEVRIKINALEPFVGFQFDLSYPSCVSYISGSAQLSGRAQGHIIQADTIDANKLRVFAYSMTQAPFTGDTGTIVTLSFAVHAMNGETSASLTLDSAVIGNAMSHDILWGKVNGMITIHQFPTVCGTIAYNNNSNTPLDSVRVFLKQNNTIIDSVITNANGAYFFSPLFSGIYTIAAGITKPWGGVNGTDALKIQRHFVGLENITLPIRLIAADVNATGTINGTDAIKIKRRFVGLDTVFAAGNWILQRNGGEGDTVIVATTSQAVNFQGLCVGDVNGSYTPGTGSKSAAGVEFSVEKVLTAKAQQELYLPVSIDNDGMIGAISLLLDYPGDLLAIEDILIVNNSPLFIARAGHLKAVWAELNPIRVTANEPFAFIKVRTSAQFIPGSFAQFQNAGEMTEFADQDGTPIKGLKVSIPSIAFSEDPVERSLYIFPNPPRMRAFVIFQTHEIGTGVLTVYDLLGRELEHYCLQSITEGLNKLDLNVSSLNKGEYILQLQFTGASETFRKTARMVIAR